jgi:hypothetical protein
MPEVAEFLSGFNLIQNRVVANYTLTSVKSTHESIKRYQEYQYHITLIFKPNLGAKYDNLYDIITSEIAQEHVIYGTRDPYRCTIQSPIYGDIEEDSDGTITFHLIGHAIKICRGYDCLNKIKYR